MFPRRTDAQTTMNSLKPKMKTSLILCSLARGLREKENSFSSCTTDERLFIYLWTKFPHEKQICQSVQSKGTTMLAGALRSEINCCVSFVTYEKLIWVISPKWTIVYHDVWEITNGRSWFLPWCLLLRSSSLELLRERRFFLSWLCLLVLSRVLHHPY